MNGAIEDPNIFDILISADAQTEFVSRSEEDNETQSG
jgi:hypothetical protein